MKYGLTSFVSKEYYFNIYTADIIIVVKAF